MKQVPLNLDEYLMSFDQKYYLSEKSIKKGFCLQKLGVGCKFSIYCSNGVRILILFTLSNVSLFHTLYTVSMEMKKNLELVHNPLDSHTIHSNSHSNSLLLLSKAILHKWGLRGRK